MVPVYPSSPRILDQMKQRSLIRQRRFTCCVFLAFVTWFLVLPSQEIALSLDLFEMEDSQSRDSSSSFTKQWLQEDMSTDSEPGNIDSDPEDSESQPIFDLTTPSDQSSEKGKDQQPQSASSGQTAPESPPEKKSPTAESEKSPEKPVKAIPKNVWKKLAPKPPRDLAGKKGVPKVNLADYANDARDKIKRPPLNYLISDEVEGIEHDVRYMMDFAILG